MAVSTNTLTEEQVKKLMAQQAADFEVKIAKLTDEAAKSRTSKNDVLKTLAESLGMEYDPEKKPDKELKCGN